MFILGISAFYHDSAACLLKNGNISAAIQEERFTRIKHDSAFPTNSVRECLNIENIGVESLDYVVFYDKPFLKFERIVETQLYYAPAGLKLFLKAMPLWIKKKLWIKAIIQEQLKYQGHILFAEHHESHAASAFYPSPFQEAAFLTMDGVGEWASTSYGLGKDNSIEIHAELNFPNSLGLFYSAFTYFTGFKVNSGEYKMMGLAPYGEPKYKKLIYQELIDVKNDGSFNLNMEYFGFCSGLKMINKKFEQLFNLSPRKPESEIYPEYLDISRSVQEVVEEVVIKIAKHVKKLTGLKNLCLAGGVALNCVANGKLLREHIFDNIWIQPASGDAGGAIGAAMLAWHQYLGKERHANGIVDQMNGSLLGNKYKNREIERFLNDNKISFIKLCDDELFKEISDLIASGKIIGWFQGRMEFGPRALGSRSILADPRDPQMQKKLNQKIKFRESFRPFAPSILENKVSEWFEMDCQSPYMLLTSKVTPEKRKLLTDNMKKLKGFDKLSVIRSEIPSVTHVDFSARVQTVSYKRSNQRYYNLIKEFNSKYRCPVLINTSFNVRGEPIVCSPEDAFRCFVNTGIDYLVMENYVISKSNLKHKNSNLTYIKSLQAD